MIRWQEGDMPHDGPPYDIGVTDDPLKPFLPLITSDMDDSGGERKQSMQHATTTGMGKHSGAPHQQDLNITENRTDNFGLQTGQFRDPDTGKFEPGGPPPDYSTEANRYRANDGEFKSRPADHYDEPAEVRLDSLEPKG